VVLVRVDIEDEIIGCICGGEKPLRFSSSQRGYKYDRRENAETYVRNIDWK
jgi:hypothetical protein